MMIIKKTLILSLAAGSCTICNLLPLLGNVLCFVLNFFLVGLYKPTALLFFKICQLLFIKMTLVFMYFNY